MVATLLRELEQLVAWLAEIGDERASMRTPTSLQALLRRQLDLPAVMVARPSHRSRGSDGDGDLMGV